MDGVELIMEMGVSLVIGSSAATSRPASITCHYTSHLLEVQESSLGSSEPAAASASIAMVATLWKHLSIISALEGHYHQD